MMFADHSETYASTKDYRDELAAALAVANKRLSAGDYDAFAQGIEAEIARLDSELTEYYDVLFSGNTCGGWTPIVVKAITLADMPSFSMTFNSPSQGLTPWTGSSRSCASDSENNAFAACAL